MKKLKHKKTGQIVNVKDSIAENMSNESWILIEETKEVVKLEVYRGLEEVTAEYVKQHNKKVPNNKKNDIEWIKSKLKQ